MKITRDLLVKLRACQQGLDLLDKYPDGATLTELADDPDTTLEDFYFARHYFHFSDEEMKIYNDHCQIKNCGGHVLRSAKITNSNWVYNSTDVQDSNYVGHGEKVIGSTEVANSIDIKRSNNIINSKNIGYSENVADSDNIYNSENVINSSYINWCGVINSSFMLDDCQFMYKCRNTKDSYFCGFVEDSNHCIFCNNIHGVEYQIFNKQVTQEEFNRVKEILLIQLQAENVDLLNVNEKNHLDARFSYDLRFDRMFEKLSEQFYGWVGSLPEYDEQVFFLLFFTTLK